MVPAVWREDQEEEVYHQAGGQARARRVLRFDPGRFPAQ